MDVFDNTSGRTSLFAPGFIPPPDPERGGGSDQWSDVPFGRELATEDSHENQTTAKILLIAFVLLAFANANIFALRLRTSQPLMVDHVILFRYESK